MSEELTNNKTAIEVKTKDPILEMTNAILKQGVTKSGKNTYHKFKYFTSGDILSAVRTASLETGIPCFVAGNSYHPEGNIYGIEIQLGDRVFSFTIPGDNKQGNPAQSAGGTFTYATRYAYCLLFNISDDSGSDLDSEKQETKEESKNVIFSYSKTSKTEKENINKNILEDKKETKEEVKESVSTQDIVKEELEDEEDEEKIVEKIDNSNSKDSDYEELEDIPVASYNKDIDDKKNEVTKEDKNNEIQYHKFGTRSKS